MVYCSLRRWETFGSLPSKLIAYCVEGGSLLVNSRWIANFGCEIGHVPPSSLLKVRLGTKSRPSRPLKRDNVFRGGKREWRRENERNESRCDIDTGTWTSDKKEEEDGRGLDNAVDVCVADGCHDGRGGLWPTRTPSRDKIFFFPLLLLILLMSSNFWQITFLNHQTRACVTTAPQLVSPSFLLLFFWRLAPSR